MERMVIIAAAAMDNLSATSPSASIEMQDRILAVVDGETDAVAIMATIACELHHHFPHFHWTGFYRVVAPGLLKIGPYQGGHGCLAIPFERGICGRCAREQKTVIIPDVKLEADHIACSSSTRSEIVVPVFDAVGNLRAVLDVDSDFPDAFHETDALFLEGVCAVFHNPAIYWA
jgi:GAF domain-containing protein